MSDLIRELYEWYFAVTGLTFIAGKPMVKDNPDGAKVYNHPMVGKHLDTGFSLSPRISPSIMRQLSEEISAIIKAVECDFLAFVDRDLIQYT